MSIAAKLAGLKTTVSFISELDQNMRAVATAIHKPNVVYESIDSVPAGSKPACDIYTAGFPCQDFSAQGKGKGAGATRGRLSLHCVAYIQRHKPPAFILENVKNIISKKHFKFFNKLISQLKNVLDENGQPFYVIKYKVLDAKRHGVPQSRPRLWLVGHRVRRGTQVPEFQWPAESKAVNLQTVLGRPAKEPQMAKSKTNKRNLLVGLRKVVKLGGNPSTEPWVIDLDSSKKFSGKPRYNQVPCITRARGGSHAFFVTSLQRRMTTKELMRSQGIPVIPYYEALTSHLTDRQLGQAIGNGWAIPVAVQILKELAKVMNWKTY